MYIQSVKISWLCFQRDDSLALTNE